MATTAAALQAAYDNLATSLAMEIAYEAAHGPKPSYTLDGEGYQWTEWKEAMGRMMRVYREQINAAGLYIVSSRGRAR